MEWSDLVTLHSLQQCLSQTNAAAVEQQRGCLIECKSQQVIQHLHLIHCKPTSGFERCLLNHVRVRRVAYLSLPAASPASLFASLTVVMIVAVVTVTVAVAVVIITVIIIVIIIIVIVIVIIIVRIVIVRIIIVDI